MNVTAWKTGAGPVALALLLSACGGVDRNAPPRLAAGHDACLECGMIISELRFASGYVDSEGTSHGFDDLGCLARYEAHRRDAPATIWVMDFKKREWIRAADAWFVHSGAARTPMGYGIVALGDSTDAARLAGHDGGAFRFNALRQQESDQEPGASRPGAAGKE